MSGFAAGVSVQRDQDDQDLDGGDGEYPGVGEAVQARVLQASTSEVYGDPEIHPQTEDYWGHVNPIGPRSCYDEGKRVAE